jgi:hypothetical protein
MIPSIRKAYAFSTIFLGCHDINKDRNPLQPFDKAKTDSHLQWEFQDGPCLLPGFRLIY